MTPNAVDYLTKPINPAVLRSNVNVFVDLFRKTRALAALNAKLETQKPSCSFDVCLSSSSRNASLSTYRVNRGLMIAAAMMASTAPPVRTTNHKRQRSKAIISNYTF